MNGGNPPPRGGRTPNHGHSVVEWINKLGSKGLSRSELEALGADDSGEPIYKRQAALSLARSLEPGFAKNGRPWAIEDTNLQLDRTLGKPKQHVEVTRTEVSDPRELMVRLAEVLAESPELRAALGVSVPGLVEGAAARPPGAPNEA